jgi:archaellin
MNGVTAMVLLITGLIVAIGGVAVIYENTQVFQQVPHASTNQEQDRLPELEIINIVGTEVEDETYKYLRIQVEYTGDEPLDLNDTHVQLRTSKSVADLDYRNGTTQRNVTTGFYTQ